MSLLLLYNQPGGGSVSADLATTDASDTLAASVTLESLQPEQAVSLGGRNKLLDVATRRVRVALSVTDDSDQVYAAAKVAQVLRVAKVQSLPTPRTLAHAALDDADSVGAGCAMSWPECDTLQATAKGTWPERYMVTTPKRKLVSSKYEAVTL